MLIKYNNYLLFKPKTVSQISILYYIGYKRIILKYKYKSIPNIVLYYNYKKDLYIHFSKECNFIEAKLFYDEICAEECKISNLISLDESFRIIYNKLLKCS